MQVDDKGLDGGALNLELLDHVNPLRYHLDLLQNKPSPPELLLQERDVFQISYPYSRFCRLALLHLLLNYSAGLKKLSNGRYRNYALLLYRQSIPVLQIFPWTTNN